MEHGPMGQHWDQHAAGATSKEPCWPVLSDILVAVLRGSGCRPDMLYFCGSGWPGQARTPKIDDFWPATGPPNQVENCR